MVAAEPRYVAFREVQRFRQWWVWLLIYGIAALSWYGFVQQIVLGRPFGSNPAPDWMMWLLFLLFGIGLPLFFHRLKMIVEVREDHIHIRYAPLTTRELPAHQRIWRLGHPGLVETQADGLQRQRGSRGRAGTRGRAGDHDRVAEPGKAGSGNCGTTD
jgi:hypothetical protein